MFSINLNCCFILSLQSTRGKFCEFTEEFVNPHYKYKLAESGKDWYIGFKKNGKPIKATRRRKTDDSCFRFRKSPPKQACTPSSGPKVDMCNFFQLESYKSLSKGKSRRDNKHQGGKKIRHPGRHVGRRGHRKNG